MPGQSQRVGFASGGTQRTGGGAGMRPALEEAVQGLGLHRPWYLQARNSSTDGTAGFYTSISRSWGTFLVKEEP